MIFEANLILSQAVNVRDHLLQAALLGGERSELPGGCRFAQFRARSGSHNGCQL